MKRIVTVILMAAILCVNAAAATASNDAKAKMDEELLSVLADATDPDEVFPVVVTLLDTLDLSALEDEAYRLANVTKEEMAQIPSEEWMKLSEEEKREINEQIGIKQDRIKNFRNQLLEAHYSDLSEQFLLESSLPETSVSYASIFTPYVYMKLTAAQIDSAAECDMVVHISYNEGFNGENLGNSENMGSNDDTGNKVSVKDAMDILRHIAGSKVLTAEETAVLDKNSDGKITVKDASIILRTIAYS